jgi:hypothetical protein
VAQRSGSAGLSIALLLNPSTSLCLRAVVAGEELPSYYRVYASLLHIHSCRGMTLFMKALCDCDVQSNFHVVGNHAEWHRAAPVPCIVPLLSLPFSQIVTHRATIRYVLSPHTSPRADSHLVYRMLFALSVLHSSNQKLELPHVTSSTPHSCSLEIVGIGCLECLEGGGQFLCSFTLAAAVAIMYLIESANPFIPLN